MPTPRVQGGIPYRRLSNMKSLFFCHQVQFFSRQNWPFLAAFLTLPEMRGGLPKLRGGKRIVMKSLAWYMCNDWWPSKRLGCLVKPIKMFVFFICGSLFWERWCEHDDQSASPSSLYCLVFLSSQRSNQRSKKKENIQNFTANPPSIFSNS